MADGISIVDDVDILAAYLKEKSWMLPVEWMKRVGRYIKSGKKMSVMTESYDTASGRIVLLKKYRVI